MNRSIFALLAALAAACGAQPDSLVDVEISGIGPGCTPSVTASHAGINGTIPANIFDRSTSTFFKTSHLDWQYVQIDLGCAIPFTGLRRSMTGSGSRLNEGEQIQISTNGTTWTQLTGPTTFGWNSYTNYGANLHAWRNVPYGWSAWLRPNTPSTIRYLRFHWDGNNDQLDEVQIDSRIATSDRSGISGTTPWTAIDGNSSSGFETGYTAWQYVQLDFGSPVPLTRVRRNMSSGFGRNGQGEGFSYSLDGTTWTDFTTGNSSGWGAYVAYATGAWHSVPYGWSAWLSLQKVTAARYVRFRWDGNNDRVNEIEVDYPVDRGDPNYDFVHGATGFETNVASHTQPRFSTCQPPFICPGFEASGARYSIGFTGTYDAELFPFPYPTGNHPMKAVMRLRDTGSEVRGSLILTSPFKINLSGACGWVDVPAGTELDLRLTTWAYDGRFTNMDSTYQPIFGDTRRAAMGTTVRPVETFWGNGTLTMTFHAMVQAMHIGQKTYLAADIIFTPSSGCSAATATVFAERREDVLRQALGYATW